MVLKELNNKLTSSYYLFALNKSNFIKSISFCVFRKSCIVYLKYFMYIVFHKKHCFFDYCFIFNGSETLSIVKPFCLFDELKQKIFHVCMNINTKIETEDDFELQYIYVYREMSKIASGIPCNAISAYNSIFSIATSHSVYVEKLYWNIGDFLYVCAKERRSNTFNSSDWFETYSGEFDKFTTIVESINALSVFLNTVLIKNDIGRKVDEFGYLLWNRCVIQNIEPTKKTTLCKEFLDRIERPSLGFKKVLLSLKKIIPNLEEPLYIYEKFYEKEALAYLNDVYANQLDFEELSEYVAQVEEIFVFESQRMNLIFLEESNQKVIDILNDICVTYHYSYVYKCIYDLLSNDRMELQKIHKRIGSYSEKFCEILKDATRDFIGNIILMDINNIHIQNKDDVVFFDILASLYKESEDLIRLYFDDKRLADNIFIEKLNNFKNQTYNERLINFNDKIITKDSYNEMKDIFIVFIRFITDTDSFCILYHESLKSRLLSYKYIFNREKENLECLKTSLDVITYKNCVKMLKDVNWSIMSNKLMVPFLESDIHLPENAQHTYFTSVLNLCAWPFDEEYDKKIKLGKQQLAYKNATEGYFTSRFPDRKLIWLWEESAAHIELTTDKTYSLKMNILQATVFLCFEDNQKLTLKEISEITDIKNDDLNKIMHLLESFNIIIKKEDVYALNANFYSYKSKIYINQPNNISNLAIFDYSKFYKDNIIKKITASNFIEKNKLEGLIIADHSNEQPFNKMIYDTCLQELIDDGAVAFKGELFSIK